MTTGRSLFVLAGCILTFLTVNVPVVYIAREVLVLM
jgi:hypothetical protein